MGWSSPIPNPQGRIPSQPRALAFPASTFSPFFIAGRWQGPPLNAYMYTFIRNILVHRGRRGAMGSLSAGLASAGSIVVPANVQKATLNLAQRRMADFNDPLDVAALGPAHKEKLAVVGAVKGVWGWGWRGVVQLKERMRKVTGPHVPTNVHDDLYLHQWLKGLFHSNYCLEYLYKSRIVAARKYDVDKAEELLKTVPWRHS